MGLSLKQKRFCEEYAISGNATDAAKKAGYSEKTAYSIGTENLKKPEIQNYLSIRSKQRQSIKILPTTTSPREKRRGFVFEEVQSADSIQEIRRAEAVPA